MFIRIAVIAAATLAASATIASADVKTACAPDVKSYCSGIEPKGGKLRDCMAQNRAKLSDACKLAVADRLLERQAARASGSKDKKGSGMAPDDE